MPETHAVNEPEPAAGKRPGEEAAEEDEGPTALPSTLILADHAVRSSASSFFLTATPSPYLLL